MCSSDNDNLAPEEQAHATRFARRSSRFARALSAFLIGGVKVYQYTLGWVLGGRCRYEPSCSYYFIGAVEKYGPIRGAWKGICRICRCHPFYPGGYDPP
ncbi:MAG: membrane protein insertion efficiency factor YidD [Planctomycetaceae bacterium]|nr:membrane protein insertion efficiency factor YidD [Planctomycetaceae bacterium]